MQDLGASQEGRAKRRKTVGTEGVPNRPEAVDLGPPQGGRAGAKRRSAVGTEGVPNRPEAVGDVIRGPIKSKTVFPVLILHLLAHEADTGSGLMARIENLCHGLLAVNTNTIYPLLRRLEERGFIVGEWEHPTKRSRRFYRITPEGRARLDRIKSTMLPYLEMLAGSVARLRRELYEPDPIERAS
jgi:PadR family transcriptional regulator, regulatory protein PadR